MIHGSHPLFTPVIAEQARRFARRKYQFQLFVSALWGDKEIRKFDNCAIITVVKSFNDSNDRNDISTLNQSLAILRNSIAEQADCIVAIGGKLHHRSSQKQGVSEELEIAASHNLPAFVLSGFGGAAEFINQDTYINPMMKDNEAKQIMSAETVSFLPSKIISIVERSIPKMRPTRHRSTMRMMLKALALKAAKLTKIN